MNSFTIKIESAELAAAINNLAAALKNNKIQHTGCVQHGENNSQIKNTGNLNLTVAQAVVSEASTEPETVSPEYTVVDVRKAIGDFSRKFGIDKAKEILKQFGADKVSALPTETYDAFIDAVALASKEA